MGMYTEINVCFDLQKDTPNKVIDILHSLIDGDEVPAILPSHEFFECDRWEIVACGGSYYFDGLTNSKMKYDNISKCWKVNIRANLKNYDCEIENFLNWLAPYIDTYGFIGYMRYEECENPILIYVKNGEAIFKEVESI